MSRREPDQRIPIRSEVVFGEVYERYKELEAERDNLRSAAKVVVDDAREMAGDHNLVVVRKTLLYALNAALTTTEGR